MKGCRAIDLEYDEQTTKGDWAKGKLKKVTYTAWDPVKKELATVPIAEYGYTGTGDSALLTKVTDSRTGDTTSYAYDGKSKADVPLLASTAEKTSKGVRVDAPTYYHYGSANGSDRGDWLELVTRGDAQSGDTQKQLARFVYGVSPVGNGTDLPKLAAETVQRWDQRDGDRPTTGYAVFGAGKEINTSKASGVAAADWKFADLQYTTDDNRVVNTSSYAAGAWQSTATVFNKDGNAERSYDARAIRSLLAEELTSENSTDGVLTNHSEYASVNTYYGSTADEAKHLATLVDPGSGTGLSSETDAEKKAAEIAKHEATAEFLRGYVTDTLSPVTTDENDKPARVHTHTTYTDVDDVDAGGMPRMLVKKVTTTQQNSTTAGTDEANATAEPERVLSEVENDYNAFNADGTENPDKTLKSSGWVVGSPTKVTTVMADTTQNIVVQSRFDDQGRVIESRQPNSAGGDAGATKSVYYTAGTNADAACGNNPVYAGYLCKNTPQGAGSVAKHQTGFNIYGQPATFTETSTSGDGAERTTKQTYRPEDGQELRTTVTTSGLTGSTPVQAVEKVYDDRGVQTGTKTIADATGAATEVKWTQDLWGRTTSYTNSLGETTTTQYDGYGNVAKTVTPKSTTTYKYGALSQDGDKEYQGVVTSMTISDHGAAGQTGTYTATYDGDGNLLTQGMPGGFAQEQKYDDSGKPTTLSYSGPIKDAEGTTSTGTWISWQTVRDVTGRIVGENTPNGDVLTGSGTEGDSGADYDRKYEYDRAGRLTQVTDTTAAAGELRNTDPEEGAVTPVSVRKYSFDKNGNRTKLTTSVDGTETSSRTWAYDAADRVGAGAGYVYDGLGRQTTIPAVDAPRTNDKAAGAGDITVGYYDDDAARSISRSGVTTTIERDTAGRRLNLTTGASKEVKHYTDDSDNPSWSTRTENGSSEVLTRYESTIGGDLALTITNNVVELAVNNPHGDTVTTIPLTGDEAGKGIKGWAQFDEYGNQLSDTVDTGATTYGWHGADQRALDTSGLILMGARLYNSVTGLFTSRDPVDGGNTTTYAHPQDPIGMQDTAGTWGWFKRAWGAVKRGVSGARSWVKKKVRSCSRNFVSCVESGLKLGETVAGFAPGAGTGISLGLGAIRWGIGLATGRRGATKEFLTNSAATVTFYGKAKAVINMAKYGNKVSSGVRGMERGVRYAGGAVGAAGNYSHLWSGKKKSVRRVAAKRRAYSRGSGGGARGYTAF